MADENQMHEEITESVNPKYFVKKEQLKNADEYAEGIKKGDRKTLSRVITFIESTKNQYRELGQSILEKCYYLTGNSIRIGITGVPGVGKSTFIEKFGLHLIQQGKKVAVLAIDPSSNTTKGSILGDKTRMEALSSHENAFIRPTASGGVLGGVADKTREAVLLCEASGYDMIIIETVGVGQSEISVKSMVDFFLLLMLAGAGDELQGIKRGIIETADLIVINKADQQNVEHANLAQTAYQNALSLFPPHPAGWKIPVKTASAFYNTGIAEVWEIMKQYEEHVKRNGYFNKNRKQQSISWMHEAVNSMLRSRFYSQTKIKSRLEKIEEQVRTGKKSPVKAASDLIHMAETLNDRVNL